MQRCTHLRGCLHIELLNSRADLCRHAVAGAADKVAPWWCDPVELATILDDAYLILALWQEWQPNHAYRAHSQLDHPQHGTHRMAIRVHVLMDAWLWGHRQSTHHNRHATTLIAHPERGVRVSSGIQAAPSRA